jgi:rhodanese-related sulfurtransferase
MIRPMVFALSASLLGAAAVVAPAPARACEGAHEQAALAPRKVTVAEVSAWQEKKLAHTPVDANGAATRSKQGVIPGAVLLSSASRYDLRELPPNKNEKLVFYCASESCSASETAATRALESGYTDVNVLPAGISGWKAAGQKTQVPRS